MTQKSLYIVAFFLLLMQTAFGAVAPIPYVGAARTAVSLDDLAIQSVVATPATLGTDTQFSIVFKNRGTTSINMKNVLFRIRYGDGRSDVRRFETSLLDPEKTFTFTQNYAYKTSGTFNLESLIYYRPDKNSNNNALLQTLVVSAAQDSGNVAKTESIADTSSLSLEDRVYVGLQLKDLELTYKRAAVRYRQLVNYYNLRNQPLAARYTELADRTEKAITLLQTMEKNIQSTFWKEYIDSAQGTFKSDLAAVRTLVSGSTAK